MEGVLLALAAQAAPAAVGALLAPGGASGYWRDFLENSGSL